MKLSNSGQFEIDWLGVVKTARHFIVLVGGAALVVLLDQALKEFVPNVNLGAYDWVRPALLIAFSTALEALRRYMTDYSNNS